MSVTIHGATTANTGAVNATSLTLTLPTCTAGDVLYLLISNTYSAATFADPTGWTLLDTDDARSDNFGYLYTKTAASGDSGGSVTFSFAAACRGAATAIALTATHDAEVRGAHSSSDVTTLTIPAITPIADDCLRLAFIASCTRDTTDTPGMTAPSGWTEQSDTWTSGGSGNGMEVGIFTTQLTGQAGTEQAAATVSIPGNSHSGLMFSVTAAPTAPAPPTTGAFVWDGTQFVHTVPHLRVGGTWQATDVQS